MQQLYFARNLSRMTFSGACTGFKLDAWSLASALSIHYHRKRRST